MGYSSNETDTDQSVETEIEQPTELNTSTEQTVDLVKQFKKSIFAPFWRNPNLNSQSTASDHIKHAANVLIGKHSDVLKNPFSKNPFIGLMLQLLKLNDLNEYGQTRENFFSIFEFLKLPSLKSKREVIEEQDTKVTKKPEPITPERDSQLDSQEDDSPSNEVKESTNENQEDIPEEQDAPAEEEKKIKYEYVIDPNSCPVKDIIRKNGNIKQLENHLGLIMSPLEAAALLCVEYSQHLRSKGRVKTGDAQYEFENTSPFLAFWTNIANRTSKNRTYKLEEVVQRYYRVAELIFYFTVRLWFEIAALITTPIWQLAQTIIAATLLTITFPIWYPISKAYYSCTSNSSEETKSETPDENNQSVNPTENNSESDSETDTLDISVSEEKTSFSK